MKYLKSKKVKNKRHRRPLGDRHGCPKTGKMTYQSLEDAQAAAKIIRKRNGAKVEGYQCWYCNLYHMGHGKSRAYKLKLRGLKLPE